MPQIGPLVVAYWQLAAVVALAYVARLYGQYHRLRQFKGPATTGFSAWWMILAVKGKKAHLAYSGVNEKYGALARIGPNDLLTSSPELLWRMSSVRSTYTKGDWYNGSRIQPGRDNVFSGIDEDRHTSRRAQLAPAYSGKDIPSLETEIDDQIHKLLHLIRTSYVSTPGHFRPMDLARKAQFFTLDVITKIAFGEAFGDLENDKDMYEYIKSTEDMLEVIIMAATMPLMKSMFTVEWIGNLMFPSDKDGVGIGKLIGIAKDLISRRFGPKPIHRQDMLDSFMRHGLKQEELVSESLIQILAGSDTSATTIRATMLYLMSHPRVYRKLQDEIDAAVKARKSPQSIITAAEAAELPYLQAVIKEGMRIWPAVTGLLTKVTPPEGDTVEIDGETVYIPGNTKIGYDAWGVHHNTAVFGEDANVFRPERWLEKEGEELGRMQRTAELIWGWGKYQCLGKPIATIELNKVFFELLRNFDFSVVDPTRPWKSANVGLWMQSELWVEVTERKPS
ncbi:pisatin demethylase [Mytilinidion resinicola]|uniref:Cytochrome P450 monooxygenase ABA1 n=1 Tax=Mytilinidion resinicola TaxID=574789 RepID=A0A6A6YJI3_9PEZI|nr:pisatin demethylase [Mytilinidion resinicola]KAF2809016.1 pisatin demethylase [Mytilinidion resinicola]